MTADYAPPFVSVIVPARNERKHIVRCLDALVEQDYPIERTEILFVDGNSSDGTTQIVENYCRRFPHIRLLNNYRKIVPAALNSGLHHAKGQIIIRIDGHCVPGQDYISSCVDRLHNSDAMNVGGPMKAVGEGYVAGAIALATNSPFGVGNARFHYAQTEQNVDTVYLGAYRREVFHLVGLFDEDLVRNQDDEFNYRIRAAGYKVLLSPKIRSEYYGRRTFRDLFRQYFQYGYWKVRVARKHPRYLLPRHFVPPAFALIVGLALVTSPFNAFARRLCVLILGAYGLGSLLAALHASRRRGTQFAPAVSLAFACVHLAYGSGFLAGLFSMLGRKLWQR